MRGLILLALVVFAMTSNTSQAKPTPPKPKPKPNDDPELDDDDDLVDDDEDTEPAPMPHPKPSPYEPVPGNEPLWILPGNTNKVRTSSFGQGRPYGSDNPKTHHAGVDVRAIVRKRGGDPVLMPEDGTVIRNAGWSGRRAKATYVQLHSGPVLIFGAMDPDYLPPPGTVLKRGELVGRMGVYPKGSTMLHLEMWKAGMWQDKPRPRGPWKHGEDMPAGLVDPTPYMQSMVR